MRDILCATLHKTELMAASRIDDVLISLRRVMRATDIRSKQLARIAGLTTPQVLVMKAIHAKPDATISDIGREVSLAQATVTTIIDRLESRELVARERDADDRRKVKARLTPAGAELLEKAPTPLHESFVEQFHDLDDWEQSQMVSVLQRLAKMMDASEIDASPMLHAGDISGVAQVKV